MNIYFNIFNISKLRCSVLGSLSLFELDLYRFFASQIPNAQSCCCRIAATALEYNSWLQQYAQRSASGCIVTTHDHGEAALRRLTGFGKRSLAMKYEVVHSSHLSPSALEHHTRLKIEKQNTRVTAAVCTPK